MDVDACYPVIGFLYTFEFNEDRVKKARHDFEMLGSSKFIRCTHRNVLENGFELDDVDLRANAVFLDLPSPWIAVKHADRVLKPQGKLCSFSPCIEQVQKTCDTLRDHGYIGMDLPCVEYTTPSYSVCTLIYVELVTFECLRRTFDGTRDSFFIPDFGDADGDMESQPNSAIVSSSSSDGAVKKRKAMTERPMTAERVLTKPFVQMKGHTGYLTFARKPLPSHSNDE